MRQLQENALIEKALQGDLEAFEMLVKKYQSSLVALAWNILGDPDDAHDAAQETFLQAYTNLERFDREKNFKTWIFSIAAKRSIDRLRKQKSFLKYFNKTMKEKEQNPNPHVTQKNEKIEESEIFSPLLEKLKNKERIAISLKINENYSAKEIGAVLDCSESTARVHLFNARKKLKKELEVNK